jgi:hypothetical protein
MICQTWTDYAFGVFEISKMMVGSVLNYISLRVCPFKIDVYKDFTLRETL